MGTGKTKTSGLDVALFWLKVKRHENCWLWTGSKDRKGYGHITRGQENFNAHRYAWIICNGPIPSGQWVLHKCDVPSCVRPSHLYLGTHDDNMRDMKIKKRKKGNNGGLRGETHGCHKLEEHQVRAIRGYCAEGKVPQREIAKMFCVTQATVSGIHKRRSWRHLDA